MTYYNPNPENKPIRFINSEQQTLFTIPDGGRIVVTHPKGDIVQKQWVGVCEYSDDTHVRIDGEIYHIRHFVEAQERTGATVEPEIEPEMVENYRITYRTFVGDKVFTFGVNPEDAAVPYATWQCENGCNIDGHYWHDKNTAFTDLFLRTDTARTGRSYDYRTLINESNEQAHDPVPYTPAPEETAADPKPAQEKSEEMER
jgi:hypothetical protein